MSGTCRLMAQMHPWDPYLPSPSDTAIPQHHVILGLTSATDGSLILDSYLAHGW